MKRILIQTAVLTASTTMLTSCFDEIKQVVMGDTAPAEQAAPAEPAEKEAVPGAEAAAKDEPASQGEPEYVLAPDFHVYDKDGNPVPLSEFFGKPIVLNFWTSWAC